MKSRKTFGKWSAFAVSILCAQLAHAFELSPKKPGVSFRAHPATDAAVLKTLQGNERLTVVSKSGLYWAVTLGGQKGFVLGSEVQPARSGDSDVKSNLRSVIQGNKDGTPKRTRNAVMGIRGLDDAEDVSGKTERSDPNATNRMEKRQINKEGVQRIEEAVNKENERSQAGDAK